MRSIPIPGHRLRALWALAFGMSIGGCGQVGPLYLVMQPEPFPPITHRPLPVPTAVTLAMAPCVSVLPPGDSVAPVAAPFAATSVEQVPYLKPQPPVPSPAPASLTDILPACADFPEIILPTIIGEDPDYP